MRINARAPIGAISLVIDVVIVVVFAAIGRASHGQEIFGVLGSGLATTAWPFLASLMVAWLVVLAWQRPYAPVRTGIPVWFITVAGGMLLRFVSNQGTALPFILVAAGTLLLLLVGWRVVATVVHRMRQGRQSA